MRASKKRRNQEPARGSSSKEESSALILTDHQEWSGPLPPPAALREFDALVENGAERIFREWEQEAAHRRTYELQALRGHIRLDTIGRITAFVFAMSALGLTGWCAAIGQPWVAAVLGGGTIATIATALVYKERSGGRSKNSN